MVSVLTDLIAFLPKVEPKHRDFSFLCCFFWVLKFSVDFYFHSLLVWLTPELCVHLAVMLAFLYKKYDALSVPSETFLKTLQIVHCLCSSRLTCWWVNFSYCDLCNKYSYTSQEELLLFLLEVFLVEEPIINIYKATAWNFTETSWLWYHGLVLNLMDVQNPLPLRIPFFSTVILWEICCLYVQA